MNDDHEHSREYMDEINSTGRWVSDRGVTSIGTGKCADLCVFSPVEMDSLAPGLSAV